MRSRIFKPPRSGSAFSIAASGIYLVNDDYQMLYTAWLLDRGQVPSRDFAVQSFHLLPDVLRPVLWQVGYRIEAVTAARWFFLEGLALVPLLVARLSRRMFPAVVAPFAAVASVSSWAFLERGLDLRPDLLSLLLWLVLLELALRPSPTPRRLAISLLLIATGSVLAVQR